MNEPLRKRRSHFKNIIPADPLIRPFKSWSFENQNFYAGFRKWLVESGCGRSTLNIYSVAARQALGYLNKPYWTLDPDDDLAHAWERLRTHPTTPSTQDGYRKGLAKLAEYIRLRCHKPPAPKSINWPYFTGPLAEWLQADIRAFIAHCQRNWTTDRQVENANQLLSRLTFSLRWMAEYFPLTTIQDLTPQAWYAYVDARLAAGINPKTVNHELAAVKHLVFHLRDQGRPVSERFLLLDYLQEAANLPRDVPLEQLRTLQKAIRYQTASSHAGLRRTGCMDLAWFLLMLHSGLRTAEVRFLREADIDWEGRRVRIEQSKGLKDRIVFLSQVTIAALKAYREVRGPAQALPEQFFVFRHQALTRTYCFERLRTLGKRCGVSVTPHQLRHCNATLLLNSGAPVLTVQTLLGHKWVDTTLGYARLYDGTVAADYYSAMVEVERRLALPEDRLAQPPSIGQLLAMVDALRQGTLNTAQIDLVQQLRNGLMALAEHENRMEDVKVPSQVD